VTGTQVVFRPSTFTITSCPAPGAIIGAVPVHVRLLAPPPDGSSVNVRSPIDLKYTADVARPVITGLSPSSGPAAGGTTVNINGSGFDAPVRVLFGSNQATIQSVNPSQVRVTAPAFTGTFPTETCSAAGGVPGTRQTPASVAVTVTNLDTGCTDTAAGAYVYQPDTTCVPDEAPPPDGGDEGDP
jgi:hypothetical protein